MFERLRKESAPVPEKVEGQLKELHRKLLGLDTAADEIAETDLTTVWQLIDLYFQHPGKVDLKNIPQAYRQYPLRDVIAAMAAGREIDIDNPVIISEPASVEADTEVKKVHATFDGIYQKIDASD